MTCCKNGSTPRGEAVFRNKWLNRGVVYTEEQREKLGLKGLLPPVPSTIENQLKRVKEVIDSYDKPIHKYLALEELHASDEALYFRLVLENIEEFMPLIYTPTVGEACQKFSHIFRNPRGLFVSYEDRGHVRELVANVPNERVDIIVVTDGQRILGLGDLGANGMGIPIGKLALYTACAGVNPRYTLPVTIDVGTNTQRYLDDPLYLGHRHPRITGPEYDALIAEFIEAARERWPSVLIQFEDFHNSHAYDLLDYWRVRVPSFNDDIQGTASVCVTGFYTAMRILRKKVSDQRVLFLGAGSAATGIAGLIVDAMVEEGLGRGEALARIALFDSKGLVTKKREAAISAAKLPFACENDPTTDFAQAIREVRPTAIIGVSAQAKAFGQEVIGAMCEVNERPIIFALSNPTSKAECTAEEAYTMSNGKCLFACGSPFDPVTVNGRVFVPRQGNNSYVFPGIGLGCIVSRARTIPEGVFLAAAKCLAGQVSDSDLEHGSLYPPLSQIRSLSVEIATAVAEYCFDNGLAQVERPDDVRAAIIASMWSPEQGFCCGK